jgi:2-polyprenyl-3-methyl-5-hydroxy-6-metoxy-1,4-benzoquinol methylase/ribosomal protein S18 acetylase RimI-like enzyme
VSTEHITIRAALPDDAAGIVDVMRASFAPSRLSLFIYGCSGVDRYVRAQICAEDYGCDSTFDVAVAHGAIVGMIEMRSLPDRLFLNYVAVAPEVRASRLGTRLLSAAFASVAGPPHRSMALDVHEDNVAALRWYDSLGFVAGTMTEWFVLPLPSAAGTPRGRVIGAPQAAVCHDAFGFSRITVSTPNGYHEVGKLGTRWFRITSRGAIEDPALLATLSVLDPDRRVLALLPAGTLPPTAFGQAARVTATRRLTCDVDVLRARLKDRGHDVTGTMRSRAGCAPATAGDRRREDDGHHAHGPAPPADDRIAPLVDREQFWTDYYRAVFRAGPPWLDYSNERVQIQTFASALEAAGSVEGRRCLDVGCDRGQFAQALLGLRAATVTGIDIVPEVLERNAAAAPGIRWLCGSLKDRTFTSSLGEFDLIFLLELLQYVPMVATLDALWPRVAPGGRIVAIVPNADCAIAARARMRFGPGYHPPTSAEIAAALGALPDARHWAIRGLFFREDQTIAPYELSPWNTHHLWKTAPNRLQFVGLKRPA